jgi:reverse gyrase
MEEREKTSCGICGGELDDAQREEAICSRCVDSWKREVDCHW